MEDQSLQSDFITGANKMQEFTERGDRTNEIALKVRAGNASCMELWEAVRLFALKEANRWLRSLNGRRGVEIEDLEQVAFLAVLDTMNRWRPELGAFSTLYGYRLKDALSTACGYRTRRDLNDPLNGYIALDSPLTDDSELTLADTIPDPAADIEEQCAANDLRAAVADALTQLPENERAAIVSEFWHDQQGEAKARAAALRHLRHPSISRGLKIWLS